MNKLNLRGLSDPSLRTAFAKRLTEYEVFANDLQARLMWFDEPSPYYDQQHRWYPITRSID